MKTYCTIHSIIDILYILHVHIHVYRTIRMKTYNRKYYNILYILHVHIHVYTVLMELTENIQQKVL